MRIILIKIEKGLTFWRFGIGIDESLAQNLMLRDLNIQGINCLLK